MAEATPTTKKTSTNLSLDVIEQILVRLPVWSIIKCTCVCKEWYSLISSREFIATHLSHSCSHSPPNFLVGHIILLSGVFFTLYNDIETTPCHLSQTIPSPSNLIEPSYHHCYVYGSVHGLICIGSFKRDFECYVWNPLIKRSLKIPDCCVESRTASGYHYAKMGFGFDSKRNDYKLVRMIFSVARSKGRGLIITPDRIDCVRARVYSLKNCTWSEINTDKVRPCIIDTKDQSSCFLNGAVHWIARDKTNTLYNTCILSFDMNDECFNRIELPQQLKARKGRFGMSGSKGLLSIFSSRNPNLSIAGGKSCIFWEIWVKKEYSLENSWIKICNIDLEYPFISRVLHLRDNGDVLVMLERCNDREEDLASYDPKTKRIQVVGDQVYACFCYANVYSESLLLLDNKASETTDIMYSNA